MENNTTSAWKVAFGIVLGLLLHTLVVAYILQQTGKGEYCLQFQEWPVSDIPAKCLYVFVF